VLPFGAKRQPKKFGDIMQDYSLPPATFDKQIPPASNFRAHVEHCQNVANAYTAQLATIAQHVAKEADAARTNYLRVTTRNRALTPQIQRDADQAAVDAASEARFKIFKEHEASLIEKMKELAAQSSTAETWLSIFPSTVSYLDSLTLADEKRNGYAAALSGASFPSLLTHAKVATATGDKALAAAVMVQLQKLEQKDQPIKPSKLAEALVGREHSEATFSAQRLVHLYQNMQNVDRAARQGKVDLAQALDRLRKTTFRRKDELFDAVLKKHRKEGGET